MLAESFTTYPTILTVWVAVVGSSHVNSPDVSKYTCFPFATVPFIVSGIINDGPNIIPSVPGSVSIAIPSNPLAAAESAVLLSASVQFDPSKK